MEPYLRCSHCKQFFPPKLLRVPLFQKSRDRRTCPICGENAEFTPLLASEMTALLARQNRNGWVRLAIAFAGVLLVGILDWFSAR